MRPHGAALALLASALLTWGCHGGPTAAGSELSAPAVARHGAEEREPARDSADDVHFDMLAVERDRLLRSPGPLARNPFRFGPSSQQTVTASRPLWEEPVDWDGLPPLDPLTWSDSAADVWSNTTPLMLIGVIEAPASAGRVAVVTDGDAVYHGRVGDVLGEYARIVSITPPSIELEPPGGSRYTLHMAP